MNTVKINLDPVNDGIVGTIKGIRATSGKYVVIGTDNTHRIITEEEYFDLMEVMEKVVLFIDEYIIVLDGRKLIRFDGDDYFVGSFILSARSEKTGQYKHLTEDEIEEIKEKLTGYMTDILINGERYSALELM